MFILLLPRRRIQRSSLRMSLSQWMRHQPSSLKLRCHGWFLSALLVLFCLKSAPSEGACGKSACKGHAHSEEGQTHEIVKVTLWTHHEDSIFAGQVKQPLLSSGHKETALMWQVWLYVLICHHFVAGLFALMITCWVRLSHSSQEIPMGQIVYDRYIGQGFTEEDKPYLGFFFSTGNCL